VSSARTAESIEIPFEGVLLVGRRNMGLRSHEGKGQFWGLSAPLKSTGSFCSGIGYAKTAEPIEMPFGAESYMGQRKNVLDEGQGRTNPFAAARGDKSAMRPFVKIL